jgi:hypothetical protein
LQRICVGNECEKVREKAFCIVRRDVSSRAGDFWSAATIFVFFAPQTRPLQSCLSLSQRKCVVRNPNRTVRSLFQLFALQISLLQLEVRRAKGEEVRLELPRSQHSEIAIRKSKIVHEWLTCPLIRLFVHEATREGGP